MRCGVCAPVLHVSTSRLSAGRCKCTCRMQHSAEDSNSSPPRRRTARHRRRSDKNLTAHPPVALAPLNSASSVRLSLVTSCQGRQGVDGCDGGECRCATRTDVASTDDRLTKLKRGDVSPSASVLLPSSLPLPHDPPVHGWLYIRSNHRKHTFNKAICRSIHRRNLPPRNRNNNNLFPLLKMAPKAKKAAPKAKAAAKKATPKKTAVRGSFYAEKGAGEGTACARLRRSRARDSSLARFEAPPLCALGAHHQPLCYVALCGC